VSLGHLFDASLESVATEQQTLQNLARLVVRGGWPESTLSDEKPAMMLAESYVRQTVEDDASRVDGTNRNPHKLLMLMRSLARNESTLAKNSTLRRDMLKYIKRKERENGRQDRKSGAVYERPKPRKSRG
jgi:predicted AAA+ superfamily ATPase